MVTSSALISGATPPIDLTYKPLQVGGVCNAEARIASVTNADAGKVVKVKGHIYRAGQPVIKVVSAFLY